VIAVFTPAQRCEEHLRAVRVEAATVMIDFVAVLRHSAGHRPPGRSAAGGHR
jgi:hypothetical protein